MKFRWTMMALALSAWGGATVAQPPRPGLGVPRRFTPPRAIEFTSTNGFKATCIPDGTTPLAHVELVLRTGSADDPVGQVGIAELVAEYLREGSTTRSADATAREAAELGVVGGEIGVRVRAYETILSADVLGESAPALIRLLGDLVRQPSFPPEALPRLEADLVRRLELRRGLAGNLAAVRANEILFPNHPADRLPPVEQLQALTIDAARSFHAARFVAARAHLYVAGRFDVAAVQAASRQTFEAWSTREAASLDAAAPSVRRGGASDALEIHLIDRPGTTQARLQISAPVVDPAHPDHPILEQLNILLGSVQTSRIIANVRERHGYSYNVSSRLIRRPGSSQWALTADIANDVTAPALQEVLNELARVVAEPPSEDELRRFQTFLAGILVSEHSTPVGIVENLRYCHLYGVDPATQANFTEDIPKVRPEDVHRVAQEFLRPDHLVIVVVGDRKSLTGPLSSVGTLVE